METNARFLHRLTFVLWFFILAIGTLILSATPSQADADNPLELIMDGTSQTAVHHHYRGEDVDGFQWEVKLRDYYNDEWRMKKVRNYNNVEYYVGNRYVPSNGKRYACSATVYHAAQGDVISFASQNWQKEKSFTYNMTWENETRMSGCEYWLGADRWDSYYFRNAYIVLLSGEFGGHSH